MSYKEKERKYIQITHEIGFLRMQLDGGDEDNAVKRKIRQLEKEQKKLYKELMEWRHKKKLSLLKILYKQIG